LVIDWEVSLRKRFLFALKLTLVCSFLFSLFLVAAPVQAETSVVHAALFYSPTCGHCHKVMTEDLPPLLEKYGDQLQIIAINVTTESGQQLYQSALSYYDIPDERIGVPTLLVGDTVLVGSLEIPEIFPQIIQQGLAQGGIPWPDLPGLAEAITASDQQEESTSHSAQTSAQDAMQNQPAEIAPDQGLEQVGPSGLSMLDKFNQDPLANTIAVLVLLAMLASLGIVLYRFAFETRSAPSRWPAWSIPVLSLLGFGIAAYLSYVEITNVQATCGPVGDCNTVQQSPYATLFGLIPVGLLGVFGYLAILIFWAIQRYGPQAWQAASSLAVWWLALFAVLFSIYLTFLEPFVIGASCAWCLSSALVMTLILWAATGPALNSGWLRDEAVKDRVAASS
jgi:uncharacterized membrane protein/thiol-disulfide isomerase/thioredoxin